MIESDDRDVDEVDDDFDRFDPGPEERPPVSWLRNRLLRVVVYVSSTTVIMQVAALIGLALYAAASSGEESFAEVLERVVLDNSGEMLVASHLAAAPAVWLWTSFFRKKIDLATFRSLGWQRVRALPRFGRGWIIGALLPGLTFLIGWSQNYYEITEVHSWIDFPTWGIAGLLYFALGFIIQGSTEELMVRGYVQKNLAEYKPESFLWILILPSALFALGHLANPEFSFLPMLNTFLIGIVLGAVVWMQGSLWMACGLHAGWNFALGCLWSLPVSGLNTPAMMELTVATDRPTLDLFLGGEYGPEGGLIQTILSLALLATMLPTLDARGSRAAN